MYVEIVPASDGGSRLKCEVCGKTLVLHRGVSPIDRAGRYPCTAASWFWWFQQEHAGCEEERVR